MASSSKGSGDIIGQYQAHIANKQERGHNNNNNNSGSDDNDSELDDDDFLDLLEEDDAVTQRYREQRTQQLAQQMATARTNAARATVETLDSEEALFALTTSYTPSTQQQRGQHGNKTAAARDQHAHVIVHFFRPDFTTCRQMDEIMARLARAHFGEVTFARLDVATAPFLVTKLDLRVLPCVLVLSAATGREVKRLRGFDELGNNPNDLETAYRRFEQILLNARVISRVTNGSTFAPVLKFGESRSIKTSKSRRDDSDDDDWD